MMLVGGVVLLDWAVEAGDGADIVVVNDEKNVLIVLGQYEQLKI